LGFQQKLAAGFAALSQDAPDRCIPVSAEGSQDAVAARIWDAVDSHLRQKA